MLEFTVSGSPKAVARTIEDFAQGLGNVSAIVVPWESDATTVSMAVTSVAIDGWAIEHTNLGTIKVTPLSDNLTRVAFAADRPDDPERQQLAAFFDRFAKKVQDQFAARST